MARVRSTQRVSFFKDAHFVCYDKTIASMRSTLWQQILGTFNFLHRRIDTLRDVQVAVPKVDVPVGAAQEFADFVARDVFAAGVGAIVSVPLGVFREICVATLRIPEKTLVVVRFPIRATDILVVATDVTVLDCATRWSFFGRLVWEVLHTDGDHRFGCHRSTGTLTDRRFLRRSSACGGRNVASRRFVDLDKHEHGR